MPNSSSPELERALAAIRGAGGDVTHVLETWAVDHGAKREVFVIDAGASPVERGEPYATWLVTFAPDGSLLRVDRFESRACRPLR
jgi:hypothetical protein